MPTLKIRFFLSFYFGYSRCTKGNYSHYLTFSDSIERGSTVETEKVRVASLNATEITEITRSKKKKKNDLKGPDTLTLSQTSRPVFTCLQYKSFKNTVGKGEIAHNEQFLIFP